MPAAPEFGYITREIRIGKIPGQFEPKQAGATDRNIGVAGKVTVDLKREIHRPQASSMPSRSA